MEMRATRDDIIKVSGLEHSYGDVRAVGGINFTVKRGEIFSFLGPNGAGKTTTINILTTLLPVQKGDVYVAGYNVMKEALKVRQAIGIVFQDEVLDRDLTVWETLEFHGRIYSMPRRERVERIKELLALVELEAKRNTRIKYLSGGMKRRLEIARGLMTHPKVLFLDEPTLGLDPQTRLHIWKYIKDINMGGTTIFLTTHYMDEADNLSDRISIIDHGKIVASGTPEDLKARLGRDIIYIKTASDTKARAVLKDKDYVRTLKVTSRGIEVGVRDNATRRMVEIIESLRSAGIEVLSANLKRPTLDDVFVHFTGSEMRDEGGGMADMRRSRTLRRRRA